MKKGFWVLLIVFSVLAGVTTIVLTDEKKVASKNYSDWDRDFAVADLNTIHKIFIANRDGNTVTLERSGKDWQYNGQYKAHPNSVSLILQMLETIEIRFIPTKAAAENAIKTLASHGIKVELYDSENNKLKAFYIGGVTPDERGTYMIMEGAEQPYVMHMPIWEGSLRTRFTKPQSDDWRDKLVFDYQPDEIVELSIEYPKQKKNSFILTKVEGEYSIKPLNDLTPVIAKPINQAVVKTFLTKFKGIYAEAFENEHPKKELIRRQVPFCIMYFKTADGKEEEVRVHPKPELDYAGNPIAAADYQPFERYLIDRSNGDFMLVQHLQFGPMFWAYSSFFQ